MVKVKSLDAIKKNYTGAAGTAAARYREAAPTVVWKDPAIAGQDLYEAQMSDPTVLARREKGIGKVSDSDFQKALIDKGAPVLASRITAAADKQSSGYSPYKSALEAVTLPARTADPLVNVDNRLKPIVSALVAKKKELLGS